MSRGTPAEIGHLIEIQHLKDAENFRSVFMGVKSKDDKPKNRRVIKSDIIDLMDHYAILLLFKDYVKEGIEEFDKNNPFRPLSFDEWYVREYTPNIDSYTQIVQLQAKWYQAKYTTEVLKCRISKEVISEYGGGIFDVESLERFAKILALKLHKPELFITYCNKYVYKWSEQ